MKKKNKNKAIRKALRTTALWIIGGTGMVTLPLLGLGFF